MRNPQLGVFSPAPHTTTDHQSPLEGSKNRQIASKPPERRPGYQTLNHLPTMQPAVSRKPKPHQRGRLVLDNLAAEVLIQRV